MKTITFSLFAILCSLHAFSQDDPWRKDQVMPTLTLAEKISSNKDLPLILNVGPMENIKTAITVGATNTEEGLKKLENAVASADKNREVVIYCGCCTYSNCPNIRPAFKRLQELGFKKIKVLNIPEGIKPDWSGKGYPME